MAIEQGKNEQFFGMDNDGLDEDFARLIRQRSVGPARKDQVADTLLLRAKKEEGVVTVKVGSGDVDLRYPEASPLEVTAIGKGAKPEIVELTRALFMSVVAMEILNQSGGDEFRIRHWQLVRSEVGFRLADARRMDIVRDAMQFAWLPGIDKSR